MSKVSEKIKILRLMKGYSISQFARMMGCVPNTVINWESGNVRIDVDVFEKICNIYGCTPNQLLDKEPFPELEAYLLERQKILQRLGELEEKEKAIEKEKRRLSRML